MISAQKGTSPQKVQILNQNILKYAEIIKRNVGADIKDIPGTGAAGWLGAGLMALYD